MSEMRGADARTALPSVYHLLTGVYSPVARPDQCVVEDAGSERAGLAVRLPMTTAASEFFSSHFAVSAPISRSRL